MNERAVLRRLKDGDTGALSEIIAFYTPYLYTIASNVMDPPLSREDVEEAVSDAFVRLWTHRGEVQPGKLKPWLAAVCRNLAKDALRAARLSEDHRGLREFGEEKTLHRHDIRLELLYDRGHSVEYVQESSRKRKLGRVFYEVVRDTADLAALVFYNADASGAERRIDSEYEKATLRLRAGRRWNHLSPWCDRRPGRRRSPRGRR